MPVELPELGSPKTSGVRVYLRFLSEGNDEKAANITLDAVVSTYCLDILRIFYLVIYHRPFARAV